MDYGQRSIKKIDKVVKPGRGFVIITYIGEEEWLCEEEVGFQGEALELVSTLLLYSMREIEAYVKFIWLG